MLSDMFASRSFIFSFNMSTLINVVMCNECDLFALFQDVVLSVEWKWTNVVSSVKSDQVSINLTKWDHPFYPIHSINNVYTNSMFVDTIFYVK